MESTVHDRREQLRVVTMSEYTSAPVGHLFRPIYSFDSDSKDSDFKKETVLTHLWVKG